MKTEWISVENQKPSKAGEYLVYGSWDNVSKAIYRDGKFVELDFIGKDKDITKWITHWMPLPEPPKQ